MRTRDISLMVAAFALGIAAPQARTLGATQAGGIQRAAWLQGCWEMSSGDRIVEEQWNAPRGGTMFSTGRTVRGGKLTDYEFVVLREDGDRLAYEAHPAQQASAVFLSKTITGSQVIFENLQHDFPQRIGYEKKAPDSLLAWIEGPQAGQTRRIEFPYRRVACAG